MEEKRKLLALLSFLTRINHNLMLDLPLDYEDAYVLNDLANQYHDSWSVLEIEKKYKSNK